MIGAISIKTLRDQLYTLAPHDEPCYAAYRRIRRAFLIQHEGVRMRAYDDATGLDVTRGRPIGQVTIGVGFNMDGAGAERAFQKALPNVSFGAVYGGAAALTPDQVDALLSHSVHQREGRLRSLYPHIFDLMPLNERLAIESVFFNLESLVGPKTSFYRWINQYYYTREKTYLAHAAFEIEHRSNRTKNMGIQRRRMQEATLLKSHECAAYPRPQWQGGDDRNHPLLTLLSVNQSLRIQP